MKIRKIKIFENNPKVTVFMPVYNGERYLKQAIKSILNQTFKDFEFLIIDDGSTDRSSEIIKSFKDQRIKFLSNEQNKGVAYTRNRGLNLSKGEYFVPMDCDDVSISKRLEKTVKFMDETPQVGVCGAWSEFFGNNIKPIVVKFPTDYDSILCSLFFSCSVLNGASIMRKSLIDKYNLRYDKNFPAIAEDYDFWLRSSKYFELRNYPEIFLKCRRVAASLTHTNIGNKKKEIFIPILKRNLEQLKITPDEKNINMYYLIHSKEFVPSKDLLELFERWLLDLRRANINNAVFPESVFSTIVGNNWFELCRCSSELGVDAYKIHKSSPLSKFANINLKQKIKFLIKCVAKFK